VTDMTGVAKETFQVLLRYNYTVKLYDEDGMVVAEPTEARRMFASKPNLMVSLSDADDDSSISLMFGKSTHANDIDGLMQALRTTATKYNMTFEPKQYGKEIDTKDYQNMMSVSESKKEIEMHVCEGMYGTSRSSYLQLDNAKMIVHHNARISPKRAGGRAQHIDSIFIENAAGVRTQYPRTELQSARAMTEHINAGGNFDDKTGQMILEMGRIVAPHVGPPFLAENNPVVREFMAWTEQFAPDRALLEWNDPDDKSEDHHEEATEMAINNFTPQEFLDSDVWEDTLGGRSADPNDGESELSKQEIMDALNAYISHYVASYSDHYVDSGFDDTQDIAQHLYDQTAQAIQQAGYTIQDDMAPSNPNMGHNQLEAAPESEEFTREDILLPHPNQGDGLAQGVSKAMVHDDPRNPDEQHPPGAGYMARLKSQGFQRMHEDDDEMPDDSGDGEMVDEAEPVASSHESNLARLKQLAGIWVKNHTPKE
jgi:hypothetical protein